MSWLSTIWDYTASIFYSPFTLYSLLYKNSTDIPLPVLSVTYSILSEDSSEDYTEIEVWMSSDDEEIFYSAEDGHFNEAYELIMEK